MNCDFIFHAFFHSVVPVAYNFTMSCFFVIAVFGFVAFSDIDLTFFTFHLKLYLLNLSDKISLSEVSLHRPLV